MFNSNHQINKATDCNCRPTSTDSVDSTSSLTANAPDSRPTSMHSSTEAPIVESNQTFVRDWVEKHRTLNGKEGHGNSDSTVKCENQVLNNVDSPSLRRPKPENKKIRTSTPKQSPAVVRKCNKHDSNAMVTNKLEKSQLPGSANSSKRVTEWLRSVSMEQEETLEKPVTNEVLTFPVASEVPICSTESSCSLLEASSVQSLSQFSGCPDQMADCGNIVDISFDSSVDTAEIDTNAGGLNNRESIYELQMDEQLEKTAKGMQDTPDDETFSNTSYSKEEDESVSEETLLLIKSGITHSCTVESIKTLIAEPPELQDTEDNNVYEPIFDVKEPLLRSNDHSEKLPPYITQLLRKPDGASNPNLHSELNFEPKVDSNFSRGDYIIQNVQGVYNNAKLETDTKYCVKEYECSNDLISKSKDENIYNVSNCKPPLPCRNICKSSSQSPSKSNVSSVTASPKSISSTYSASSKDKYGHNQSISSVSSSKSLSSNNSPTVFSSKQSSSSTLSSRLLGSKPVNSKDAKYRKEKDPKGNKLSSDRLTSLSRGTDSDSGNDSGIVATHDRKLLSPYSTVTKPRTPSHSSSGHGSDNSSSFSAELRLQLEFKSEKLHGGTSSGYESMLRDSEATGSSSAHEDSGSESSDKKKGARKKRSSKCFMLNILSTILVYKSSIKQWEDVKIFF